MHGTVWIVMTTVGTQAEASVLAKAAVESGWAACGQVDAEMSSHYYWKGALQESRETRIVFKASSAKRVDLMRWLYKNHPYEVAQILAWEAASGDPTYTAWVEEA